MFKEKIEIVQSASDPYSSKMIIELECSADISTRRLAEMLNEQNANNIDEIEIRYKPRIFEVQRVVINKVEEK